MNILFNILAEAEQFNPPKSFYIGLIALMVVLILPWIFLLIYCLTLKYRVRVFSDNILIGTYYFKAGVQFLPLIEMPSREGSHVEGLYLDSEFKLPLEYQTMPKKNLKIYIKWIKE